MTLLVRDEEDVLPAHLDFHLARGVDEVILMDNLSRDATADIAREYERDGRLRYLFQPADNYSQGRWVSRMARLAIEEARADWVIHSDADEFWWSAGSIKDELADVPSGVHAVAVPRTNYVTRILNGAPFWRAMDVRHAVSRKVAHRALPEVEVVQGNHALTSRGQQVPTGTASLEILHFPVRTREQFLRKIANGGAAYARNAELDPSTGDVWRHLYGLHRRGELEQAFARELHTDSEIAAGLLDGSLIRCHRLRDALDAAAVKR